MSQLPTPPVPAPSEPHDEGYTGPATLVVRAAGDSTAEFTVEAVLRGHFQPIDGRYHWYGRLAAHPELSELLAGKRTPAVLYTPEGEARGDLSDPDPWNRYRIDGTSRPPFRLQQALNTD
ncbi:DUF4873 domain-containing protein [Streptomyces triticagri]|uniref:DUF4873 domain-containing protein n=1 Tax=Streptomyces triticagri TaxID=2293568 RepID=A0A372M142_9ACTN|nr:DUF4873 domain-containing protein [Streptomyces triticagri]RFU84539.1 DUF4873 domain-containing protein [Streptomyces triticagri]